MSQKRHSKPLIAIVLTIALVGVAVVVFLNRNDPGETKEAAESTSVAEVGNGATGLETSLSKERVPLPGTRLPERETVRVLDVAQTATQLHQAEGDPAEDLLILQDLLSSYRRILGANPEGGLNFEIVGNMAGNNERKLAVFPPDHPSLNPEGELLDRWGTPYWFHPVSRDLMEVVSAGPDKNLWTEDDVRID